MAGLSLKNIYKIYSEMCIRDRVERDWTGSQREKIAAYLETGGTQESIAARLNVSQSSVNRAFKGARLYEYRYALEQIRAYLERIYGRWEP